MPAPASMTLGSAVGPGRGAVRIGRASWPRSRGRWPAAENRILKAQSAARTDPFVRRFTNSPCTAADGIRDKVEMPNTLSVMFGVRRLDSEPSLVPLHSDYDFLVWARGGSGLGVGAAHFGAGFFGCEHPFDAGS